MWGKRNYADGSVDLWAEVARPVSLSSGADRLPDCRLDHAGEFEHPLHRRRRSLEEQLPFLLVHLFEAPRITRRPARVEECHLFQIEGDQQAPLAMTSSSTRSS